MKVDTNYIKLDSFLKMADVASSGGEAKVLIASGAVFVNGIEERRRGRKLYPGDSVEVAGGVFHVEKGAAGEPDGA